MVKYTASLEAFMAAVADELGCLPSYADPGPTAGNAHIVARLNALLVDKKELAEAVRLLKLMQSKMMYQEPEVAAFLSRLDAEREGSVCVDEPCPYCLRPVTDCDCCDADVDSEMGDQ